MSKNAGVGRISELYSDSGAGSRKAQNTLPTSRWGAQAVVPCTLQFPSHALGLSACMKESAKGGWIGDSGDSAPF